MSAFSYAQETGPSKEVTQEYIQKYTEEAVRLKTYLECYDEYGNAYRCSDDIIGSNLWYDDFSRIYRRTSVKIPEGSYQNKVEFAKINWGNITNIYEDTSESIHRDISELGLIVLESSSKILYTTSCYQTTGDNVEKDCDLSVYVDDVLIFIPRNRVEACLKALNHLKEISKVDDPFDDH